MDLTSLAMFLIRLFNAVVWTFLLFKIVSNGPVTGLTRLLISSLIFLGFWILTLGTLTNLGILDGSIVRMVYTGYTAVAAIVGVTLLSMRGKI